MTRRLGGCLGIGIGITVIVLALGSVFFLAGLRDWLAGIPGVGTWVLEAAQELLYISRYDPYILVLLGMFFFGWGVAMIARRSWARITAIGLFGAGFLYVFALTVLLILLPELARLRWQILATGLALLAIQGYFVFRLLEGEAEFVGQRLDLDRAFAPRPWKEERAGARQETGPRPRAEEQKKDAQEEHPVLGRLESAGETGADFEITDERVVIGRHVSCQLKLSEDDTSVSRRHARLSLVDGQFFIEDMDSSAGTFVNGQQVTEARPLVGGDEIHLGARGTKFVFRVGMVGAPSTSKSSVTMIARLESQSDPRRKLDIAKDEVIVGRNGEGTPCDIVIGIEPEEDTSISRQHARIHKGPDGFTLEDTSRNGTFVNGQKIQGNSIPLSDGDEIRFGLREARFELRISQATD